jgi:hypothetical protein
MMSDERMMPDPELMQAFVEESFEELRARVPSELLPREPAHAARAEAA